jgi:hypothetical protein
MLSHVVMDGIDPLAGIDELHELLPGSQRDLQNFG